MRDASSVPFILSWCQHVNKLSQLNKKRRSGNVHTNPDKLMYCILHICVNTNSVWCIRFGLSIHTNTPLRIRIVFARPNENAYHLLRNLHNASSIYDIWHHRIRKPPFWSIHTKMRSRRFQKSPLWRAFLKSCVFTRYVWTGPKQGILSLLFKCLIIVVKIAKLVSTLAIRLAIRASKVAREHFCPPKWKFSFKALSKSQNWLEDHGQTNHFDHEIGFFQEFLLKNHLLPTYHLGFDRSGWMVWINLITFWLNKATSHATRVEIANTTLPKPWVCLLLVTFSKQWTRRR